MKRSNLAAILTDPQYEDECDEQIARIETELIWAF